MAKVNTGLGWSADDSYLVYDAGTILANISWSGRCVKTNDGYAVGVTVYYSGRLYGIMLVSTVAKNTVYDSHYTTGPYEYMGEKWYWCWEWWLSSGQSGTSNLPRLDCTQNPWLNYTYLIPAILAAANVSFGPTIADCDITLDPAKYLYDGTAKEPGALVTYTDPDTGAFQYLTSNVDFTVSYADNINVGRGTVMVTGIGDWTGTQDAYFKIASRVNDPKIRAFLAGLAMGRFGYSWPKIAKARPIWPPIADGCIVFYSDSPFTLNVYNEKKNWDGVVEYSADKKTWNEWDGKIINSVDGVLYLRGTNNRQINTKQAGVNGRFVLEGKSVHCDGNAENLIDYTYVDRNSHPYMASYAFSYWFYGCECLVSHPELLVTASSFCYAHAFHGCTSLETGSNLPATTVYESSYESMYEGCVKLAEAAELPATKLGTNCYKAMYKDCTSLKKAQETLPAINLYPYCYREMYRRSGVVSPPTIMAQSTNNYCCYYMFSGCKNLERIPKLYSKSLRQSCYTDMFASCPKIKIYSTKELGGEYEYRIPVEGEGSYSSSVHDSLYEMFYNVGGTDLIDGGLILNTTYYTDREPV